MIMLCIEVYNARGRYETYGSLTRTGAASAPGFALLSHPRTQNASGQSAENRERQSNVRIY